MKSQKRVIENLKERKTRSRERLRTLSPIEKIAKLVELQDHYYQLLVIRQKNDGKDIPLGWQKWHKARYEQKLDAG